MTDNGATPNVGNMVSDPQFTGLLPAQQREALYKLTKDSTFSSLSDADTASFVSRMSRPTTPSVPAAFVSAAPPPGVWDRITAAVPILGRMQYGLETGFASPSTTSTGQALAKPPEAMGEERALAPEKLLTPAQQQAHPIATGIGEFAGGMTTPSNALLMATSGMLGKLPGTAGYILPRIASGSLPLTRFGDFTTRFPILSVRTTVGTHGTHSGFLPTSPWVLL